MDIKKLKVETIVSETDSATLSTRIIIDDTNEVLFSICGTLYDNNVIMFVGNENEEGKIYRLEKKGVEFFVRSLNNIYKNLANGVEQ